MTKLYSKERIIGSGTYGSVWLVKSKINNNPYVLKEVNLSSLNASERQQALTEVIILSRCKHVNIIRYKDAVIDHHKGILSIVMEYADGGDLYSAICDQQGQPFKEHTVIMWFVQICLALQYIHHKNILHRDLKTRNIFLTQSRQIKVGDFGIARCLIDTTDLATTAIGTPYYLSPEICQRKPYNYKSDVWALGCILFEIASLSHPFQACSFQHLLSLILTGKRNELPRHCSFIIQDLVQLLLDENPETRPSTDEILAMPYMQPFLSELWTSQGNKNSATYKSWNEKMDVRRHSVSGSFGSGKESPVRRSSISSVNSGTENDPLSSSNNSKGTVCSRHHSVKEKNSLIRKTGKTDYNLTYKVFHPLSLKKRATRSSSSVSNIHCLENKFKASPSKCKKLKRLEKNDESDYGYQSEDVFKTFSFKIYDPISKKSSVKTSTRKYFDAPDFQIEELQDEMLEKDSNKINEDSKFEINESRPVHYHCQHSQCQQCMLDMLWKNRIRGRVQSLVHGERSEFIQKLQSVFSGDLFNSVYQTLLSHWEGNESECIPMSLRSITKVLNFSQLQHLPLMMQLIQLDLVEKVNDGK